MTEIPFRFYRGLLYIPVTLVYLGQSITLNNCIFDTGSARTAFDTDEVGKIGIHSMPTSTLKRLVTVGGQQTVFMALVDQIMLGGKTLSNTDIEVGNLHSKFDIQGIIGTDLIQKLDWEILFGKKIIRITERISTDTA